MTSEEGSLGGLIRHVIPEFLYGDIVSSKANSQIGSDHSVCSLEAVYRLGGGEDRWSFYGDVERQAAPLSMVKKCPVRSHLGMPTSAANHRGNACSVGYEYKSQRRDCPSLLIVYLQSSWQTAFMDLFFNQGVEHS